MKKQVEAKIEEKKGTAATTVTWLMSSYVLLTGIFTKVENPFLIAPFIPIWILTSCKLCYIDIKTLKQIKLINLK